MVDVYTHSTHETVKNKIITQFMKESPLRIVIATIAFGSVLMFDMSYTGVYQQMLKCIYKRVEGEVEMEFCHVLQSAIPRKSSTAAIR